MVELSFIIPIFIGLLCYVYSLGRIAFETLRGTDNVDSALKAFVIGGFLNLIGLVIMAVCKVFERG